MFSFLKKNAPVAPSGYDIPISADEIQQLKVQNSSKVELFKELQSDFNKLLLIGDIDLFLGNGPIEIIDNKLSAALVPNHTHTYINIMGCIRFIRLFNDPKSQEHEKLAIRIFEAMVQEDGGDIYEDIISYISTEPLSPPLESVSDIFQVGMAGHRLALRISSGILEEKGEMVDKIKKVEANKHVIDRVNAFFDIIQSFLNANS